MTTLEERIADALTRPVECGHTTINGHDAVYTRTPLLGDKVAAVLAVLRDTPPAELATALGMEKVADFRWDDGADDYVEMPVFRFVRPVTGEAASMSDDPRPGCECNVYDHTGKPIAWRTWACPLHKYDGWLNRHRAVTGEADNG